MLRLRHGDLGLGVRSTDDAGRRPSVHDDGHYGAQTQDGPETSSTHNCPGRHSPPQVGGVVDPHGVMQRQKFCASNPQ